MNKHLDLINKMIVNAEINATYENEEGLRDTMEKFLKLENLVGNCEIKKVNVHIEDCKTGILNNTNWSVLQFVEI